MKKIAILIVFIILKSFAQGQNLKVIIEDIKDDKGSILVALYNAEAKYMKERFRELKLVIKNGKAEGVFEKIPEGNYAISVMHDSNNNSQLDTNAIGIPTEGYGFSNNAAATFGPPDFKKAAFDFPKNKEMLIKLKYLP